MKRARRSALAWLVFAIVAVALHVLAGRALAGTDIVAEVLVGRGAGSVLLAVALVSSRMYLFLLAPGWALHIAARTWLERRAATTLTKA